MTVSSSGFRKSNLQPASVIKNEMFLPLQIETDATATYESGKKHNAKNLKKRYAHSLLFTYFINISLNF